MKITIELFAGPDKREPIRADIDKNMEALRRVIQGKPKMIPDDNYLIDTLYILEIIRSNLPISRG